MTDPLAGSEDSKDSKAANGAEAAVRLTLAVAAPRISLGELERFLASRAAAGVGIHDEVIIAASPGDVAETDKLRSCGGEPGVSLSLHASDTTPMKLWGLAMARARGRHVAVLDARDTLASGWVDAWERVAAAGAAAIVCGPVDPGNLKDSCSWAAYLSEYGQFWAPLESEGELAEAPGNNIVFPRAALPAAGDLRRDGFWKTFHLESLRRSRASSGSPSHDEGTAAAPATPLALSISPGMVVRFERRYRLGAYLRRRYLHGRCYGGRRLEQPGAPPRLMCLGFTPLLPALRTARVLGQVGLGLGLRSLPGADGAHKWPTAALGPLVLGEIAWSWGEFAGYARGAGNACEELW